MAWVITAVLVAGGVFILTFACLNVSARAEAREEALYEEMKKQKQKHNQP
ncbi:MAG: hypothetical protein PHO10_07140 [Gemmiger sp.]|nr:hypothetical protein [Gemmiger sp.]